jgi:hypothetical protein
VIIVGFIPDGLGIVKIRHDGEIYISNVYANNFAVGERYTPVDWLDNRIRPNRSEIMGVRTA